LELSASSVVILYFLSLSRGLLVLVVFVLWVVVAVPVLVALAPELDAPVLVFPEDIVGRDVCGREAWVLELVGQEKG
jgi:hypothetical protein